MDRHAPFGRRFGSPLDLGLAAFAAGSAAFAIFAMPEGLFSGAIAATGLPSVLSAAQPPLGATARLAVIAAAALATFAFVWSLMRALDRRPVTAKASTAKASEADLPRMRRADAHPDAPVRRPLLARQDLEEPEDVAFEEVPPPVFDRPAFREPAPEMHVRPAPAPQPEPAAEEPVPLDLTQSAPEPSAPEPIAPVFEPAPAFEPAPPPAPEPAPPAPTDEDSLTALMQRLDSGLTRKRQALAGAPAPDAAAPAPEPEPVPEPVRHRLRSAIRDLEQIAARNN